VIRRALAAAVIAAAFLFAASAQAAPPLPFGHACVPEAGVLFCPTAGDGQRGEILFELFGGGWRFARGHVAKLELLRRDPNFLHTGNFRFSVRVMHARVEQPGR
jgi:hypothetical protein